MLFKHGMGPLMAPLATAGGGGGTGTGGGEGSGSPPAPLTMEAVGAEIDKRLTASITTHFDKFRKENGTAIDEKLAPITTGLAGINEALAKLTQPPANGNEGNNKNNVPPELNVTLKQLQDTTKTQGAQIETLKKEKMEADQRAEKSERHSVIHAALSNLHFVNDAAAATAFNVVEPNIKRLEDNSLIGAIGNGDHFPVDAFVKDYLTKEHSYLLRASGASGSGAPANGGGPRMGVKADIGDIKSGMSAETRSSVLASIGAALQETR